MVENQENISLEGKIALVTGASRGIGRAVAINLAKKGAHIIALARTKGGLEDLDDEIKEIGSTATLVPQDLKEFEAIDNLGAAIYQRFKKLDIMVGNAAILGPLSPLSHIDPKDWQHVYDLNVTANYRLIRSMDKLFRLSSAARLVFLTSESARLCKSYWGAYSSSKAALEALVKCYASEVKNTNINVNIFSPGPVNTKLRKQAFPGEDDSKLTTSDEVAVEIANLCMSNTKVNSQIIRYIDIKNK